MTDILVPVLVALAVGPGLVMLLWIQGAVRRAAHVAAVCLDPTDPQLPLRFARHLATVQRRLYALGFDLEACLYLPAVGRHDSFVGVLANPRTGEYALVTARFSRWLGRDWLCSASVEFVSELAPARYLTTDNSRVLRTLGPCRRLELFQAPWLRDPAALYRLHRARMRAVVGRRPALVRARLNPSHLLAHVRSSELYQQFAAGWLYLDEETALALPTFRGAWVAAWRETWPAAPLRMLRARWQAARLLAGPADSSTPDLVPLSA